MTMPLLPVSDLEKLSPVFRGKAGHAILEGLRKLLGISQLSDIYDWISSFEGPDFASSLLDELGIDFEIGGAERLESLPEGPFITISNHPYGGLDGIILLELIGHRREGFRVMVNEFLSLIEPLRPSWIVVNPKNNDSNEVTGKNIQGVREVLYNLKNGHPVGFFPSGAVSDFKLRNMRIEDREWQEPLIRLIRKAKVPIVPIRFFDGNSPFFYFLGLVNWKIRTLRLPRELLNKGKARIRVGIGDVLSVGEQSSIASLKEFGMWLRNSVYRMRMPEKFEEYTLLAQKSDKMTF